MNSNEQLNVQLVAAVKSVIYPAVIAVCAQKGVIITAEEIDQALQLPAVSVPNFALGQSAVKSSTIRPAKTAGTVNSSKTGCPYVFSRGKNVGAECGKNVNDTGLCNAHSKTLANIEKFVKNHPKPSSTNKFLPGANPAINTSSLEDDKEMLLEMPLENYKHSSTIYINSAKSWVLYAPLDCDNEDITVIGKDENGLLVELTDEEESNVKESGFDYVWWEEHKPSVPHIKSLQKSPIKRTSPTGPGKKNTKPVKSSKPVGTDVMPSLPNIVPVSGLPVFGGANFQNMDKITAVNQQ